MISSTVSKGEENSLELGNVKERVGEGLCEWVDFCNTVKKSGHLF